MICFGKCQYSNGVLETCIKSTFYKTGILTCQSIAGEAQVEFVSPALLLNQVQSNQKLYCRIVGLSTRVWLRKVNFNCFSSSSKQRRSEGGRDVERGGCSWVCHVVFLIYSPCLLCAQPFSPHVMILCLCVTKASFSGRANKNRN